MFNQLFKLFKRKTKKTPLEDYTTEVFVCILNQYDDIKNKFCKLLDLPDDDYIVTTQVMYRLEDDNDCIIDIQLKGIDNICFIENKVDSSEGVRQLERYSKVLDLRLEKETRLVYCTKYAEEKQIQHHNFKQFRWFEIAKFLKEFEQYIIVRDYISFLKNHNMAQEFTLLPQDYLTMNYLRDVASKINNHLDKVKNPFIAVFSPDNLKRYLDVTVGISNVIDHDRLVYLYKNIVNGGGDSDLKYGFQLSKPNIYVSIYIAKNSPQYDNFYSLAKNIGSPYELDEITKGIALELKLDISKYLNDANVDKIISDWFCQTFDDFKVLVKNNSNIDWNICCPPKI